MAKGSIQNKDSFLNHIAEQLGRERNTDVPLPEWEYQPQWDVYQDKTADELCGLFKKNSEEKDTHVLETTKQQLPEMMEHVMETYGGAPMVSTDDERFGTYGLTDVLAKTVCISGIQNRARKISKTRKRPISDSCSVM